MLNAFLPFSIRYGIGFDACGTLVFGLINADAYIAYSAVLHILI